MQASAEILQSLMSNVKKVVVGKDEKIQQVLTCWLAGGHILIDDIPGTGKTIMARAMAKSVDVPFRRVQFTPDLLPSDILGTSIYNQKTQEFEFKPGPLFTTFFLADEINRATPRTQSALLECMGEGQVSVDGHTFKLDPLFFTMATQNPVDQLGTYSLPEAQMDRFMMRISMGYPMPEEEIEIVKKQNDVHPIHTLQAVESHERLLWLKNQIPRVEVSNEIYHYVMSIVEKTRKSRELRIGSSPRGTIALTRAAQTLALFEGLGYVRPHHVFKMIKPVLSHRLILQPETRLAGRSTEDILDGIIKDTPVPVAKQ